MASPRSSAAEFGSERSNSFEFNRPTVASSPASPSTPQAQAFAAALALVRTNTGASSRSEGAEPSTTSWALRQFAATTQRHERIAAAAAAVAAAVGAATTTIAAPAAAATGSTGAGGALPPAVLLPPRRVTRAFLTPPQVLHYVATLPHLRSLAAFLPLAGSRLARPKIPTWPAPTAGGSRRRGPGGGAGGAGPGGR